METNQSAAARTLARRLAGYSSAAGALMALSPSVSGQVIHSGTQAIELNMPFDTVGIDLNEDGIQDFRFMIYGSSIRYTYGPYYLRYAYGAAAVYNAKTDTYKNSWVVRNTYIASTTYSGGSTIYTYPILEGLNIDTEVGPDESMWANLSYPYYQGALGIGLLYTYVGPSGSSQGSMGYGDFFGETKYIGVRFYIGAEQHYGWIRARIGEYIEPLIVFDWAYESTPGDSIMTGVVGDIVPPLATLSVEDDITQEQTINVTIGFSEEISGLTAESFMVSNGEAGSLLEDTGGLAYVLEVTATSEGQVGVTLPAGSVIDLSGNELEEEASVTWEYEEPPSFLSNNNMKASIYPNPVSGVLTVELETSCDISLISTNGSIVYQNQKVLSDRIDVQDLAPGIYLLEVKHEQGIKREKIIIR